MGLFEGFADPGAKFFKQLAKNNDREWFQAHKAEFEEGWNAPMKAFLAQVRDAVDAAYPHCELDSPKVFRIFRDVRFSKDKAPYKTHIGGYLPLKRGGKKATDLPMALYFQVGATQIFAAAGHYMMEPDSLARFRAALVNEKKGKELDKILATLKKKHCEPHSHGPLKRVPRGFDPEHPRAALLKLRGLTVGFPELPPALLASPKLVKHIATDCKTAAPLVEWLAFATQ